MDHAALLATVHYNPLSGEFIRLRAAGNRAAGTVLGNPDAKGYLKALVLGKYVRLNRLAWFYTYGVWPTKQIDHKNQCKTDNRLLNLRDCGTSSNCLNQLGPRTNNTSGYQGVHQIIKTGRFRACCSIQGVKQHLGVFDTPEAAHAAYMAFKTQHIPERIK